MADDGVVNRKVAVTLLEQRGHQVTAVDNGRRAVEALHDNRFDVVLMDVQMPVLDGFAATAAIREIDAQTGRHTPIVAMTAHAMKGDRERCLLAGMDDYVSKPFRPDELYGAVERVKPTVDPERTTDASLADASLVGDSRSCETPTAGPCFATFDRKEALRNVGGSDALLGEMVGLFVSECPKQMAAIAAAYQSGEHEAVMRAAHMLKGSAALLGAEAATAAAQRIEILARDDKLSEFPDAWAELQRRIGDLVQELGAVLSASE